MNKIEIGDYHLKNHASVEGKINLKIPSKIMYDS